MHQHILFLLYMGVLAVAQVAKTGLVTATAPTCPFSTPRALLHAGQDAQNLLALLARQQTTTVTGACPADHFGCSNLGAPQACCSNTAICTTDSQNHVACCASGASCTGIIGGSTGGTTASTTQGTGGTAISTNNVVVVTAGTPVNGISRVESHEGWALGLLAAILGFIA